MKPGVITLLFTNHYMPSSSHSTNILNVYHGPVIVLGALRYITDPNRQIISAPVYFIFNWKREIIINVIDKSIAYYIRN